MFNPNFVQIQRMLIIPNYGYSRTPTGRLPKTNALEIPSDITSKQAFCSTVLWPALFRIFPNWCHGVQWTGDCVSWMLAHMCDLTDAIRFLHHPNPIGILLTSSESLYGFGKCELYNSYRFHSAGMMGIDAVLASEKFGRLLRKRYELDDLSSYNGKLASAWAEAPRPTHGVPDYLEHEALNHRMKLHLEVTDCTTAAAFIEAGYPVGYCGDSRWGIKTNERGEATAYDSGSHAMVLTGVRYEGKQPAFFWVANTGHGDHVDCDVHQVEPVLSYRNCGSWVPQQFISPVLRDGDCYVISVDGIWNIHQLLPECIDPVRFA